MLSGVKGEKKKRSAICENRAIYTKLNFIFLTQQRALHVLEHCKFLYPEKKNEQKERITLGKIQFQCLQYYHHTIQLGISVFVLHLPQANQFTLTEHLVLWKKFRY